jgi:hypothetical protein
LIDSFSQILKSFALFQLLRNETQAVTNPEMKPATSVSWTGMPPLRQECSRLVHVTKQWGKSCSQLTLVWLGLVVMVRLATPALANESHAKDHKLGAPVKIQSVELPLCSDTSDQLGNPELRQAFLWNEVDCNIRHGRSSVAALLLQRILAQDGGDERAQILLFSLLDDMGAKGSAYDMSAGAQKRNSSWWSLWFPELRRGGWLAVEVGSDSNINRATDSKVVQSPLLNYRSLSLNPILTRRSSSFVGANAGMEVSYPLSPYVGIGARGAISTRYNTAEYVYLPNNYHLATVLSSNIGNLRLEAEASSSQYLLARLRVVDRQSFSATASMITYGNFIASLSADSSTNFYPQFSQIKAREQSFAAKGFHPGTGLRVEVYQGTESSTGQIKDLDRKFQGYKVGWDARFSENLRFGIHVDSGQSRYQLFSRLFDTNRIDRFGSLNISCEYRAGHDWYVTPKWISERNSSTIALSQYQRTQYLIEVRKEF